MSISKVIRLIFSIMFLTGGCVYAQVEYSLWDDLDEGGGYARDTNWVRAETYVVTASRKRELVQEAPANISVFTARQIESLGVQSLSELMSYIPGATVAESFFGYTSVIMRGNFPEHYNNKMLLLINGHPSWEVVNGSFHLEMIPMSAVKQVEVVRGPGSVLYGTNAFAGVINVITYDGTEQGGDIYAKGGSFDTYEGRFSYGGGSEDVKFFVAGSTKASDGWDMYIDSDEAGNEFTVVMEEDLTNLYVGLDVYDFSLNLGWFDHERQKVGIIPIYGFGGPLNDDNLSPNEYEGYFVDLQYATRFTDTLGMQANVRYDYIDKLLLARLGSNQNLDQEGEKTGFEVQVNYNPTEAFGLVLGGSTDTYDAEPYLFLDDSGNPTQFSAFTESYSTDELGLYLQASLKPTDALNLVAGLRYTDNDLAGDDTSPNIGAVYSIGEKKYIKILYGEAFRSPNHFEQRVSTGGVLFGNADLAAETVKTVDAGVDLTFQDRYNLKANYFWLETEDSIERADANGDGVPDYVNGEGFEVQGLEFDFTGDLTDALSLFVNGTFRDSEDTATGDEVAYLTEITANLGVEWKLGEKVSISPNLQYVGDQENPALSSDAGADAYTLVHLKVRYDATENFSLALVGRNVFDEEYTYPEWVRGNIGDLGTGPEAAVYLTGKVNI
jgi:iron complex outermembrane receptor protein